MVEKSNQINDNKKERPDHTRAPALSLLLIIVEMPLTK